MGSTCNAWMKACLAIEFLSQIQTDEFCQYIGEGGQPSEDVKLLGKKHVGHHGTSQR